MVRGKIATANKSIVWLTYTNGDVKSCLPSFKYGDELFPLEIKDLDVFFTCYNPEKTPNWERGELRNNQTELWG